MSLDSGEDGEGEAEEDKAEDEDMVGHLGATAGPFQKVVDFRLKFAVFDMFSRVWGRLKFGQKLLVAHQNDRGGVWRRLTHRCFIGDLK